MTKTSNADRLANGAGMGEGGRGMVRIENAVEPHCMSDGFLSQRVSWFVPTGMKAGTRFREETTSVPLHIIFTTFDFIIIISFYYNSETSLTKRILFF